MTVEEIEAQKKAEELKKAQELDALNGLDENQKATMEGLINKAIEQTAKKNESRFSSGS